MRAQTLLLSAAAAALGPLAAAADVRDIATARSGDRGRIVVTLAGTPTAVEAAIVDAGVRVTLAGVTAAPRTWDAANTDLLKRFETRPTEGGLEILLSLGVAPTAVRATATPSGAILDLALLPASSTAQATPSGAPTTGLYASLAPGAAHHGGPGGHFPRALPPPDLAAHEAAATSPVEPAAPASAARTPPPVAAAEAQPTTTGTQSYEVAAVTPPPEADAEAAPSSEADVAVAIAEAVAAADETFTEFAGEMTTGSDGLRARPPDRPDRQDPTRILVDRVDPAACVASGAAIAEDPWDLDHLEPHAQCLLHEGAAEAAAAVYERLLTFAPDAPGAHMGLGVAKQAMGDARAARQHFEDARVLALSDSDAMRARALIDRLGE